MFPFQPPHHLWHLEKLVLILNGCTTPENGFLHLTWDSTAELTMVCGAWAGEPALRVRVRESWPLPHLVGVGIMPSSPHPALPAVVRGADPGNQSETAGPAPHFGSTVELALVEGMR